MDIFAGDHALNLLRKIAETTSLADVAGDACLLRLMIADGATVNDGMFIRACTDGHTEIVRLLLDLPLERGVHPDANDNQPLQLACANGFIEIVRLLLELPLER